jgi:hypothetical protein
MTEPGGGDFYSTVTGGLVDVFDSTVTESQVDVFDSTVTERKPSCCSS